MPIITRTVGKCSSRWTIGRFLFLWHCLATTFYQSTSSASVSVGIRGCTFIRMYGTRVYLPRVEPSGSLISKALFMLGYLSNSPRSSVVCWSPRWLRIGEENARNFKSYRQRPRLASAPSEVQGFRVMEAGGIHPAILRNNSILNRLNHYYETGLSR